LLAEDAGPLVEPITDVDYGEVTKRDTQFEKNLVEMQ
jgi:hypothetical protein